MSEVTQIIRAIEAGDERAANELLPLVYSELRRLAAQRLAQEKPGQTLDATALVHEAFLRLVGNGPEQQWDHRGHFFAAAAEAIGASRASLTTNMRLLIASGLVRRLTRSGGRTAYYRIDDDMWERYFLTASSL